MDGRKRTQGENHLKIHSCRLLEEKQATTSSTSLGDGEYLRSLSDSTGRRGEEEEEREGWGERRSISLGEEKGEEKTQGCSLSKVEDYHASPTSSSDQECLAGETFSSLSSLSNFLKRKEKERGKEEKEVERSKQLSIDGSARESGECTRQLGHSQQVSSTLANYKSHLKTDFHDDEIFYFGKTVNGRFFR